MPAYYPVFLDVRGRRCIVFGGNHEGERKVQYLLECGADVTLIAAVASPELARLASDQKIIWTKRSYRAGDLEGAWVAIIADTSDVSVNEAVSAEARARNVLLNVTDVTHLCTFIAPSIVQRQDVTVAVSTAGTSPALARRLREELSSATCRCLRWTDLGPMLADVRKEVRARKLHVTPDDWQQCMTDELVDLHRAGRSAEARAKLVSALEAKAKDVRGPAGSPT
jgi:siroheme synthase-like protein